MCLPWVGLLCLFCWSCQSQLLGLFSGLAQVWPVQAVKTRAWVLQPLESPSRDSGNSPWMTGGPRLCPTPSTPELMQLHGAAVRGGMGEGQPHRSPGVQGSELRQPGLESGPTSH